MFKFTDGLRMLNPVTEINGFEGKFDAMTSPIHQETNDFIIQAWRVSVLVGNKVSLNWKLKASSFTEVKVSKSIILQGLYQMIFYQHSLCTHVKLVTFQSSSQEHFQIFY